MSHIETISSDNLNPVIVFMNDSSNSEDFSTNDEDKIILNMLNNEHKNNQLTYKMSYIFYVKLYLQLKKILILKKE